MVFSPPTTGCGRRERILGGEREFWPLLADRNLDGNAHLGKAYPDFSKYPGSDWFLKFCIVFKALKNGLDSLVWHLEALDFACLQMPDFPHNSSCKSSNVLSAKKLPWPSYLKHPVSSCHNSDLSLQVDRHWWDCGLPAYTTMLRVPRGQSHHCYHHGLAISNIRNI